MYGYVYKTTNILDKKFYIGQKKSESFLGNKYLGSGVRLNNAIKKYGKENFKIEMIDTAEDKKELDKKEIYWIEKLNARNRKIGYNITKGGDGANLPGKENPMYGKKHSKEVIKIMSELKKGEKNPFYGRHHTEETKLRISQSESGEKNHNFGKHLSEEIKRKISDAQKGEKSHWYGRHHTLESRKKMSELRKGEKAYWYGKTRSEETRKKMSESRKLYLKRLKGEI